MDWRIDGVDFYKVQFFFTMDWRINGVENWEQASDALSSSQPTQLTIDINIIISLK